ncbi:MAG: CopG family transcriptional regulator [Chloroflexi bacterium]|nr:CopG family transcriptional regulator [Chloroflexota bacterium]
MVRTQIELSEAQARALKSLAAAQKKKPADLIRQAVDQMLRARGALDRAERKRRALAAAGRFHSGLPDLSTEHDRY